jgi:hypothetical protein
VFCSDFDNRSFLRGGLVDLLIHFHHSLNITWNRIPVNTPKPLYNKQLSINFIFFFPQLTAITIQSERAGHVLVTPLSLLDAIVFRVANSTLSVVCLGCIKPTEYKQLPDLSFGYTTHSVLSGQF